MPLDDVEKIVATAIQATVEAYPSIDLGMTPTPAARAIVDALVEAGVVIRPVDLFGGA